MVTLRRATENRPSGSCHYKDFDVCDGDRVIGRIMLVKEQAPSGEPWFFSITIPEPQRTGDRGYAASREQAMASFKAAWERKRSRSD